MDETAFGFWRFSTAIQPSPAKCTNKAAFPDKRGRETACASVYTLAGSFPLLLRRGAIPVVCYRSLGEMSTKGKKLFEVRDSCPFRRSFPPSSLLLCLTVRNALTRLHAAHYGPAVLWSGVQSDSQHLQVSRNLLGNYQVRTTVMMRIVLLEWAFSPRIVMSCCFLSLALTRPILRFICRVNIKPGSTHGKAYGRLVWRGRVTDKEEEIRCPRKDQWSMVAYPPPNFTPK